MSTFNSLPPELKNEFKSCSICGQKSDACWAGHINIAVCRECALTTLPKLIADALLNRPIRKDTFENAALKIRAEFFYGCTHGLALIVKQNKKERRK